MSKLKVDQISKATGASPAIFTLPAADGTADQHLKTDGSGQLSFATPPAGGGGLTDSSQWRLTTDFTGDAAPIASNLEEVDTDGYGRLGSAMTESSGIFSFPSTGYWLCIGHLECEYNGASDYQVLIMDTTVDDGTWTVATGASNTIRPATGWGQAGATTIFLFDVTDVSTHKVRFSVDVQTAAVTVMGRTDLSETYFTFTKLGDT